MPIREPPYKREWREHQSTGSSGQPTYRMEMKRPKPVVTYGLMIAIGVTYALQLAVLGAFPDYFDYVFLIDHQWYLKPWTLVTSTFAHGGFQHLFLNGLFLYFLGPPVEAILGRARFFTLFIVSGAIAGIAQGHLGYWMNPETAGALGASGALMALFGVLIVLTPKSKLFIFPIPAPIPMWAAGIVFIALDLLGAFTPGSNVGNFAHLAGLGVGALEGWYMKGVLKRRGLHISYG